MKAFFVVGGFLKGWVGGQFTIKKRKSTQDWDALCGLILILLTFFIFI